MASRELHAQRQT